MAIAISAMYENGGFSGRFVHLSRENGNDHSAALAGKPKWRDWSIGKYAAPRLPPILFGLPFKLKISLDSRFDILSKLFAYAAAMAAALGT